MRRFFNSFILILTIACHAGVVNGQKPPEVVTVKSGDITVLMADRARMNGQMKIFNPEPANVKRFWVENWTKPEESFQWTVNARTNGLFKACLLIYGQPGVRIEIAGPSGKLTCTLQENGWDKLDVPGELKLGKGLNIIAVQSLDAAKLRLKSLELVNLADQPAIEKRIIEFRSNAGWLADTGYGLMFQWGGWGYPEHGPAKKWPGMIDDFNVKSFADMVEETGAAYVVWSATWITYHFPAPIKAIDRILPGRTSSRDLIGDLAGELDKRGIKLILYYHLGHGPGPNVEWWKKNWVSHDDMDLFFHNFCAIATEVGERYGHKLAGWMIDDGMVYYPAPFEQMGKALKAGNPDRLVSYNSWIMPRFTEFQDFYFGEGNEDGIKGSGPKGGNGIIAQGPQKGLQGFACFVLDGPDWGIYQAGTVIRPPAFSREQIAGIVNNAMERKLALSFNLLMYEDGSVSPQSREMMRYVKSLVRNKPETGKGNSTIWQKKPGDVKLQWESQVFHLGNGYFGASAYCGTKQEVFTLGEKTFWTGGPGDDAGYNFGIVPEADCSYIADIKRLTSEGNIADADKLVAKYLCKDTWLKLGGFSTIGSLVLSFDGHEGEVTGYERCLNLDNSTLVIKYEVNGVKYTREYFCSYPDRILAMHITADKPNSLGFSLGIDLMHKTRNPVKSITPSAGLFEVAGNMNDNNRPYRVKMKVVNEGGALGGNDSLLIVKGSNAVTIYYTVATDYQLNPPLFRGADPDRITTEAMSNAVSLGYDKLRERHISDYKKLYDRTTLHLENPVKERELLPTNERLFYYIYNNDVRDLGLRELAFNFGKYMLISVSRPGTIATGLQGVWNNRYQALWNGTFQLDMNVTQTYMFGNALNLSECQEPFIDYIRMLSVVGEKAAKGYYGSKGWTSFIISDLWGGLGTLPPAPFLSGGWLSLILWEQYDFDRNSNYLKEIYPVLKGASEFFLENLIEYKDTKRLVFWGTYSAEHSSSRVGVTAPNFQDIAFIAETFENTIKASEKLNTDRDFREKLIEAKSRLMPYKVGRMGQFQEWVEDIDDPHCQHRHLSHLLALQPCKQVNPHLEPELAEAIKVTLKQRGDNDFVTLHRPDLGNSILYPTACRHEGMNFDNFTSQAWSRSARASTWLRVYDGDHADKICNDILRESTLENMVIFESRAHYQDKPIPDVPFFMESMVLMAGNATEMVLQSQNGELELLPALPSAWRTGSIRGIRGRGACTVDIEWKEGKLVKAAIKSDQGGIYTLRYKDMVKKVKIEPGGTYVINGRL